MKLPRVRVITDASACVCPSCRHGGFHRDAKRTPLASCLLCKGTGQTTVGAARRFGAAIEPPPVAHDDL